MTKKKLTPEQYNEYRIKSNRRCPRCYSDSVADDGNLYKHHCKDGIVIYSEVWECLDCDATWNEQTKLIPNGYIDIKK